MVNDEPWLVRTTSRHTGTRVQPFCDAIRSRDRRCVISNEEAEGANFGTCGNALYATLYGGYEKIVQILVDAGADVNAQVE